MAATAEHPVVNAAGARIPAGRSDHAIRLAGVGASSTISLSSALRNWLRGARAKEAQS